MTNFIDTDAADAFIATAASRETSEPVMEAIAFLARNEAEAIALWEDGGTYEHQLAIWERATGNGNKNVDLEWGAEGERWAQKFVMEQ